MLWIASSCLGAAVGTANRHRELLLDALIDHQGGHSGLRVAVLEGTDQVRIAVSIAFVQVLHAVRLAAAQTAPAHRQLHRVPVVSRCVRRPLAVHLSTDAGNEPRQGE